MGRLRFFALQHILRSKFPKSIINPSVCRRVLLALLGPTAFVSTLAVVVVNNLAIIVIIIEGIIVVNFWLDTAADNLPARVGVKVSAQLPLIKFGSDRRALGRVCGRSFKLGWHAAAGGRLAVTRRHATRYAVASSSHGTHCSIGIFVIFNRGLQMHGGGGGLGAVRLPRW
jgi:hypothetical protein